MVALANHSITHAPFQGISLPCWRKEKGEILCLWFHGLFFRNLASIKEKKEKINANSEGIKD